MVGVVLYSHIPFIQLLFKVTLERAVGFVYGAGVEQNGFDTPVQSEVSLISKHVLSQRYNCAAQTHSRTNFNKGTQKYLRI